MPMFIRFRLPLRVAVFLCACLVATNATALGRSRGFTTFESDPVRPLSLSPDGSRLYLTNTPGGTLEIFDVSGESPTHVGSTPVGLEPVAVAARSNDEVWVVNHLSDSVSIVDVRSIPARVTRTLLLCDEPRDIVFGGPQNGRAFITSARRGQNCPVPALSTTPGIGRALVAVYDAALPGSGLSGTPLTMIELFSDKPRALAVSADGGTVYAAAFQSGNQTTSIHELAVCDGGPTAPPCEYGGVSFPGGLPEPYTNFEGHTRPEQGLIVRWREGSGAWEDSLGRSWNDYVQFDLPDRDVFEIDAMANPPSLAGSFSGVGTVLFNLASNPVSGKVYVSNTEAKNDVAFAHTGPGVSPLLGRQHEVRITVLDGDAVQPRHLNKHIDYSVHPAPTATLDASLSGPMGMAVTSDGATIYLAAMGSNKIGVFDAAALEGDTFVPSAPSQIAVLEGPTGLVLDEAKGRLYVHTRFDNSLAVVDTVTKAEIQRIQVANPEPHSVIEGRPFLYDATKSSSNGEASCASCHVFGDGDSLAWDLGDPSEPVVADPNPRHVGSPEAAGDFHPLKGPIVTLSLRGMDNHGPLHLRGDRTGLLDTPPTTADNVASSFRTFNAAFSGLLGRDGPIADEDMSRFATFAEQIVYPPNPLRSLDNSLTATQQRGRDLFFNPMVAIFNMPLWTTCNGCHRLAPAEGFFGTDGITTPGVTEAYKTPHFRNMYQRVGMFGMPVVGFKTDTLILDLFAPGDNGHNGDQVRGFGFEHAGAVDTLFRFNRYALFFYPGTPAEKDADRRALEDFLLAFDSNLAPVVGQQATLSPTSGAEESARVDLLIERSAAPYPTLENPSATECELTVKGTLAGEARGWLRLPSGLFQSDRPDEAPIDDSALRNLASVPGQELTYTCVPPGAGRRVALDRDQDGLFDSDERDQDLDPEVPNRIPGRFAPLAECGSSWTVQNPANEPLLDLRGNVNDIQTCVDGDTRCDLDGAANGACTFDVTICFNNVAANRVCEATDLAKWTLRVPRASSGNPAKAAAATALVDAVEKLRFGSIRAADGRNIRFTSPVTTRNACTEATELKLPLSPGGTKSKLTIRTVSTTSGGARDSDRIRLVCEPAAASNVGGSARGG